MQVLLIAESSDYLCNELKQAFSGDYEVHVCTDGCTALELLHSLRPDGLIINMSLTYMDGLSVLQRASYLPPVIMALCGTLTSYIVHSLQQVGVSFIMPKASRCSATRVCCAAGIVCQGLASISSRKRAWTAQTI